MAKLYELSNVNWANLLNYKEAKNINWIIKLIFSISAKELNFLFGKCLNLCHYCNAYDLRPDSALNSKSYMWFEYVDKFYKISIFIAANKINLPITVFFHMENKFFLINFTYSWEEKAWCWQ